MKMYAEVEECLDEFLTSAQDVGESSASRFSRFTSREQAPIPVRGEADWTQSQSGCNGEEEIPHLLLKLPWSSSHNNNFRYLRTKWRTHENLETVLLNYLVFTLSSIL
jgi:hypothetical protein